MQQYLLFPFCCVLFCTFKLVCARATKLVIMGTSIDQKTMRKPQHKRRKRTYCLCHITKSSLTVSSINRDAEKDWNKLMMSTAMHIYIPISFHSDV